MNEIEMYKYRVWVNQIFDNPQFINKLNPDEYDLAELIKFIDEQILHENRVVAGVLLLNHDMKYGEDFTIQGLEKLKKVQVIIDDYQNEKKLIELRKWRNQSKKKLKPKETRSLAQYLNVNKDHKEEAVQFLRNHYQGQRGRNIAYVILALNKVRALHPFKVTNLYEAIRKEFGDIGGYEGVRKEYVKGVPDKDKNPKQYKKYIDIYSTIAIYFTKVG